MKNESSCEKAKSLHANSLFFEEIKKRVDSFTQLPSVEIKCTETEPNNEDIESYAKKLYDKLKESFEKENVLKLEIKPENKEDSVSEQFSKMDEKTSDAYSKETYTYLKYFDVPESKTVKSYLEKRPAHRIITRTHMFAICFALEMTYDDAENFIKNIYKDAFFTLQGSDFIFLHCLSSSKPYTCKDVEVLLLQLAKGTEEDLESHTDEEVIELEESETEQSVEFTTNEIEQYVRECDQEDAVKCAIVLDVESKQYERHQIEGVLKENPLGKLTKAEEFERKRKIARKRNDLHLFQQDFCNEIEELYDTCIRLMQYDSADGLRKSAYLSASIFGNAKKKPSKAKDHGCALPSASLFRPSEFKVCTNFNKLRKLYIALHFYATFVVFYNNLYPPKDILLNYVDDINDLLAHYSLGELTWDDPYDFLFLEATARVQESLDNQMQTEAYRTFCRLGYNKSASEYRKKYNPLEILKSSDFRKMHISQPLEGEANESKNTP